MGKVLGGIAQSISGKVGNLVFNQQSDGTTTVSEAPKPSSVPLSIGQKSTHQDTALASALIKPINAFIATSYAIEAKRQKLNPFNAIIKHVRKDVLTGVYPNRAIDFSRLFVAKGIMSPPRDAVVSVSELGLIFTWNSEVIFSYEHYSDHIMMMAYFPELKRAEYIVSGAQRHTGTDELILAGVEAGVTAEVYAAFITDTRQAISDSVYLGKIIW